MQLMNAPASRQWPNYFDPAFQKPQGKLDLEKWVKSKQEKAAQTGASSTNLASTTNDGSVSNHTMNNGQSNEGLPQPQRPFEMEMKKPRDPRDRIKVIL